MEYPGMYVSDDGWKKLPTKFKEKVLGILCGAETEMMDCEINEILDQIGHAYAETISSPPRTLAFETKTEIYYSDGTASAKPYEGNVYLNGPLAGFLNKIL